jgi:hypothetical protein
VVPVAPALHDWRLRTAFQTGAPELEDLRVTSTRKAGLMHVYVDAPVGRLIKGISRAAFWLLYSILPRCAALSLSKNVWHSAILLIDMG